MKGCGGDQAVSVLTSYSDNPSFNPPERLNFYCANKRCKKISKIAFFRNRGNVFAGGSGDTNVTGLINPGSGLDLSEIRLGEATLVPVASDRGELHHGLECRTVDGEILQLQLTR